MDEFDNAAESNMGDSPVILPNSFYNQERQEGYRKLKGSNKKINYNLLSKMNNKYNKCTYV